MRLVVPVVGNLLIGVSVLGLIALTRAVARIDPTVLDPTPLPPCR